MKAWILLVLFFSQFCLSCVSTNVVRFHSSDELIDVDIGGRPITSYIWSDSLTKPVLFPVRTLSGLVMTRSFPFAEVEGESRDHPHHTGVFFTCDEVNDTGFWGNTAPPPQIRHIEVIDMKGGTQGGVLSTFLHWNDSLGRTLLNETRLMTFFPMDQGYAVDFDITLTARDTTVVFHDTKEGMFAIRVASWLEEKGGSAVYTSSTGLVSAKNIWGKRAEWVRLEGDNGTENAGIVIFNHPQSTNFPTFWHVRDYGLFSANPLGQKVFLEGTGEKNPTPYELALEPGANARFLFLMFIYDGTRTTEAIEKLYRWYCSPSNER